MNEFKFRHSEMMMTGIEVLKTGPMEKNYRIAKIPERPGKQTVACCLKKEERKIDYVGQS